eukprot:tig00020629_g12376.t1
MDYNIVRILGRRPISRLATRLAAPSRQGRGGRGAAAAHVSLGSSPRGAFTAGAAGTQRRPIYRLATRLAGRSGGPSLAWEVDSRRPRGGGGRGAAAAHLLLGISTRGAFAAGATGTQRRPISRLATRLAAPSRQGQGDRDAATANLSLGRREPRARRS